MVYSVVSMLYFEGVPMRVNGNPLTHTYALNICIDISVSFEFIPLNVHYRYNYFVRISSTIEPAILKTNHKIEIVYKLQNNNFCNLRLFVILYIYKFFCECGIICGFKYCTFDYIWWK